ncbi:MAG: ParB/RepB/Spo0J family partition protein [Clostridia bacterium]|nr:ParB/RepB/Spo0J family partition protein [Clostridia bacterium]
MAKSLGRGLNAFFGEDEEVVQNIASGTKTKEEKKELEKVVELNITEVEPMLNQPRKIFDKEKLEELADSIRENGVLQPIIVVKDESGYTIVAGERRWRASKIAGLKSIPAIVKDYTDSKKKQVALIENIQREDLNIVEVARAIKELMDIDGYSQIEVAKITGKNKSTVSNIMRLLKLPDQILNYLLEGKIVEGHARALLALDSKTKQLELADKIVAKKLTVRDVERIVYRSNEYVKKVENKPENEFYYKKIEERLNTYFGYKVKLDTSKKHQRLVIEYNDQDGLDELLSRLNIEM